MDDERVPCCMLDAARRVERIRLSDGHEVGLSGLKQALEEVLALGLEDEAEIKKELLKRIKACNYVPGKAEDEYATALLKRFRDFEKEKKG
jgi:hypothetical protein